MSHERRKRILLIDDDANLCLAIEDYFGQERFEVFIAGTAAEGLALCERTLPDVVLLDQKLPDARGATLCPRLLRLSEAAKILFITAFPSFDNALEAIQAGAHNYLSKPFELEELSLALEQAVRTSELERIARVQSYKDDKESEEVVLVGSLGQGGAIRQLVELAASSDAPVLITGETGTGKTAVAKAIHYRGAARRTSFVSVNCAALPENLIEAELFGYEKGAFTGAAARRRGIFEMAEDGTLLLDEIGTMPFHLQSKLLGVLEDRTIRRIGGQSVRPFRARVIAATNSRLEDAVRDRTFREDLYYRLNVIRIHLPPLHERPRDIGALCEVFLRALGRGRPQRLAAGELEHLERYPWPGNARELRNVLERAALLQPGPELRPSSLFALEAGPAAVPVPARPAGKVPIRTLEQLERDHIEQVLAHFEGNRTHAARSLGISLSTLKRKLASYRSHRASLD